MLTEKAAMYSTLGISKEVFAFGTKIEEELKEREEYFHSVFQSSKHNALPPDTDEQPPRHHGSVHD